MNVADFIFDFLAEKGVDTAFMVSGGQAMFLVDALGRSKKIKTICTHHEQSAGMSADAYGRITGKPAVALVTAGPGSVNVINGLVGGWTDSSPMFVVSGQSALSCVQYQQKTGIRQYGIQGINIRPLVASATKFFVTVDDPGKILYYMQKAHFLATTGRPGPVWIDVPLDIQRMEVPSGILEEFRPPADRTDRKLLRQQVSAVQELMAASKRPIFIAGQGVRIANAVEDFRTLATRFRIPILTSRLGIDLIESDNELYVGRPGNYGERSANCAIQNADLKISIGCRLASALV
ncbi:MAG: thiamine pyrophosphate-binding protein, partial [Candidatus Altiarchaeota archaeon]|nr:thiamine pyrophosphate-binding protein [Candidatus Altiarchaeota archaeon]